MQLPKHFKGVLSGVNVTRKCELGFYVNSRSESQNLKAGASLQPAFFALTTRASNLPFRPPRARPALPPAVFIGKAHVGGQAPAVLNHVRTQRREALLDAGGIGGIRERVLRLNAQIRRRGD